MKAVRLGTDRVITLAEVETPVIGADQVLARVLYCGICGTDLHAGENSAFVPGVVMGHEFCGEIVETGDSVTGWRVGERFVANPNGAICGECEQCRAARYNLCQVATKQRALGVSRDGGMAEYVVLDPAYLNRIPDTLTAEQAALVEPLAVAVRAVRTAGLNLADRVAVLGLGAVGQLVLLVAKAAGAGYVLGVEGSRYRREVAKELGANDVLAPEELAQRSNDQGFDLVFECSGAPSALQASIDLLRPGGAVRLVGMAPHSIGFEPVGAIMNEVRILTGFIYLPSDFRAAIDLLANGNVDVQPLISRIVQLENYAEAFGAMKQPDSVLKVLLRP